MIIQVSPLQVHRDEDNLSEQDGASSPVSLAPELSPVELPYVLNAKPSLLRKILRTT